MSSVRATINVSAILKKDSLSYQPVATGHRHNHDDRQRFHLRLAGIAGWPEIDSIRTLHEVLRSVYGPDDEDGVS